MSDYIVSARKYRPDSFESLIGQDNIARTLKNSILRGQLAHAYLFCGPRGVGKTSTARIFAKTINCSNPGGELEPCGKCESCQAFQEGRSYNIHELDAASNNSVDDIRNLLEQVQIPPQVGKYSVYIIDEVHMLSAQAFNAFLKTLEEPPAHAVFILCTTEKHKILPTILSRCQTYDFNRITIPDMMKNLRGIAALEKVKIDDESLHVIAQKADGAMRDALTLFDQTVAFCGTDVHYSEVIRNLGVLDYEYCFSLVDYFLAGDYAKALLLFDEILAKGFNALHFVGALSSHLRDLLVARTGGLDALLDQTDALKARYRQQAQLCTLRFLYEALGITGECEAGYKASSNQRLHIEYALMRLAFLVKMPAAEPVKKPAVAEKPAIQEKPTVGKVEATPSAQEKPAAAPMQVAAEKPAPVPKPEEEAIELIEDTVPLVPAAAAVHVKAEEKPEVKQAEAVPDKPAEKPEVQSAETAPVKATVQPEAKAAPETKAAVAAEGPKPRKRGSATAKMASFLDGNAGEQVTPAASEAKVDHLPEDSEITSRWAELVSKVSKGRPRLENTLSGAALTIIPEGEFKLLTFEVINEAQKAWIEEKILRNLEKEYNALLGTGRLHLAVSVRPPEEVEQKIYMPEEKAQDLMDKNPEVKSLVKELALDTK